MTVENSQEPIDKNYFNGSIRYVSFYEYKPSVNEFNNIPKSLKAFFKHEDLQSLTDHLPPDQFVEISITVKTIRE